VKENQETVAQSRLMSRFVAALLCATACAAKADGDFRVKFDVELPEGPGSFTVLVHRDWAPIGAARFHELVTEGFYDDTRFFRVLPTFMVQFGLSGNPHKNAEWRAKTIKDEPVTQTNKPGYISFAKTGAPNSRTTQLFINYVDNGRLDGMGFAPFAEVEGDGMVVVKKIYNCGEGPNQGSIQAEGNAYLDRDHPKISKIVKATIIAPKAEL
jgi:peptidyl-prolyl cis-trans isomerase A (cyclophilin A)